MMSTITLVAIALLLWFIWRQLQRIADALEGLYKIAREVHREAR